MENIVVDSETQTNPTTPRYISSLTYGYSSCTSSIPIIIIDLHFLKTCSSLKDAFIFKKLFGLVEDDEIFCYKLNLDNDNNATILKDFHITANQWGDLIFFLRQGCIQGSSISIEFMVDNDKRTSMLSNVIIKLNEVMQTCIKLGGIPEFEKYYKNFYKKINNSLFCKKYTEYNPSNPREDKYNRYIWASHYAGTVSYTTFIEIHKISDGWSVASSSSSNFVWYRKLKNGNESDIDAVYTEEEVSSVVHEEQIEADTDTENDANINNLEYDFDHDEEEQEPWIESETQDTPYHSGW